MVLTTERLVLRPFREADAASLFEYAKDPEIGPAAGWPIHKSLEESLGAVKNVLNGNECYAVCEKSSDTVIGAVELKPKERSELAEGDDECELGFWIGRPFWGKGYIPEAACELMRRAFEEQGMSKIWCCYYEGNLKSKRAQEKLGFVYHHSCEAMPVPLLNELRKAHINCISREQWLERKSGASEKTEI